jgi:hypothetical protein
VSTHNLFILLLFPAVHENHFSRLLYTILDNIGKRNIARRASKIGFFSRPNLIFTHQGDRASVNFKDWYMEVFSYEKKKNNEDFVINNFQDNERTPS